MTEMESHSQESLKIKVIDYGMGNIQSVINAFEKLDCNATILSKPSEDLDFDALILPGVGAFGEAMRNIKNAGLDSFIRHCVLDEGKPIIGICLGMQLLADTSEENGSYKGLSLIPGHVKKIPIDNNLRLPHIGWNQISIKKSDPLFQEIENDRSFYFVHSFRFETEEVFISGTTNYGTEITASIQSNSIFGVQFHPERSQKKGLQLLSNFINFIKVK